MSLQYNASWWDFLLAMLWFTLFFMWIWLWVSIVTDIFRSHDLSGWGKALWCAFTILVPFLGVLVYLIARGDTMQANTQRRYAEAHQAQTEYIREVVGQGSAGSAAEEIKRLAELRDKGLLTPEEFEQGKAKILA